MEITELIQERKSVLERLEAIETVRKELTATVKNLDEQILQLATDNMVSELVVDDEKYKFKYEPKVFVKESVKDHSGKVELYKRLEELGYNEAIFFETAYYPAVALKKVWKELDPDTINQFAQDELIYHETVPSITSKKVKG
jgi:DNA-binding MltR family transcriptional regulator